MESDSLRSLAERALETALGAAIVVGPDLTIALATPRARELLNEALSVGVRAPDVLCGDGQTRRIEEALLAGQPAQGIVTRARRDGTTHQLWVRTHRLSPGSPRDGWLIVFSPAGSSSDARVGPVEFHGMWTQDARMLECFRILERVGPEDDTVLVRGETGAGKELVARALHELSDRRNGPFRAINCAAFPQSLLESELFGHVRGAFTGAHRDTPGHFQLAHRGTLFLDEVAELPLELQAKLLRVLETRTVIPIGGREPIAVDVRIVSATHRALRGEVEAGRFRADLMYRLRVIPVFIPPLRERPSDIALLVQKRIDATNGRRRRRIDRISPAALAALERHDWPGNVRELFNVVAYAYAMGDGPELQLSDLPPEILENVAARPTPPSTPVVSSASPPAVDPDTSERARLERAVRDAGGNRSEAARRLGMSRVTLWRRLRELGVASD